MAEEKKGGKKGIGCLVFIGLIIVIILIVMIDTDGGGGSSSSTQEEDSMRELNTSVRYTGTQFEIVNEDSFNWTNVKLEVNSQGLRSGYTLKADVMIAGETYTVGVLQFARKDGERFNPATYKLTNFSIWCDTPGGRKGHYFGEWNN